MLMVRYDLLGLLKHREMGDAFSLTSCAPELLFSFFFFYTFLLSAFVWYLFFLHVFPDVISLWFLIDPHSIFLLILHSFCLFISPQYRVLYHLPPQCRAWTALMPRWAGCRPLATSEAWLTDMSWWPTIETSQMYHLSKLCTWLMEISQVKVW